MANVTTKTPTIHTEVTKLRAVDKVNALMHEGTSQTKALALVSRPLHVSSQAVQNWRIKYNKLSMNNNGSLRFMPVTDNTYKRRFTINSISLRTDDGVDITLAHEDIQYIASLAGFTN